MSGTGADKRSERARDPIGVQSRRPWEMSLQSNVPSFVVPSPLPEVIVAAEPNAAQPLVAVIGQDGADAQPSLGPEAGELGVGLDWLEAAGVTGAAGQPQLVPLPGRGGGANHGWLVGVGDGEPGSWRKAGAELIRAANARAARDADAERTVADALQMVLPAGTDTDRVIALTLGLTLGGYAVKVSNTEPKPTVRAVTLVMPAAEVDTVRSAVRRGLALAAATSVTRDLANTPSDRKDPQWLAGTAARLAAEIPGLTAQVRDERWLAEHGFGGVLAVGGGSSRPPRLLELSWQPADTGDAPHVALIGKGITFDTGGISIKPADGMHLMRTDMAGGAAVIGATLRIAALGLPVRVTALVPCAENHVSGSAYRPGDVITHFGGLTTEVTNTDAEGRMVLADAIAYAVTEHRPDLLVDVATLTGAMKVSLGLRTGGLFASTDELAERVRAAGQQVGEEWWRMPLLGDLGTVDDGRPDAVRSEIADVRQTPKHPAGGIAAALFLREFTGGLPWAHLDIAGPARAESPYNEVTPVASGFAARTLVQFVQSYVE